MDPGKEHIATLCAVGTLGIAATGLALGTEVPRALSRPGKRKSPGADVSYSPDPWTSTSVSASSGSRRAVSQPQPQVSHLLPRPSSSLFGRKPPPLDADGVSTSDASLSQSRASSLSRRGRRRRPLTQSKDASSATATATTSEEPRPRSSWLRRVSTSWEPSRRPSSWLSVSGTTASNGGGASSDASTSSNTFHTDVNAPNRLVKRSTSPHFLYSDHARASSWFRRPATSHQRSASCAPATVAHVQGIIEQPASPPVAWSSFFRSTYASTRGVRREAGGIRTVSTASSSYVRPTLVTGTSVQPRDRHAHDEHAYRDFSLYSSPDLDRSLSVLRRHKLRKIGRGGAKSRNFTDPSTALFTEDVQASNFSFGRPSPLVLGSRSSNLDFECPSSVPPISTAPSPVLLQARRSSMITSSNKRSSATPSDPNTLDSEPDTRVFSDDDYMDFRSDTAYDSLATRATASSHSGYRQQPKIETIFDEPSKEHINGHGPPTLEALMQRTSLSDARDNAIQHTPQWLENLGIGIQPLDHDEYDTTAAELLTPPAPTTPERRGSSSSPSLDKLNATPLANPARRLVHDVTPSSPASVIRHPRSRDRCDDDMDQVMRDCDNDDDGRDDDDDDDDDFGLHEDDDPIDWSPKSTRGMAAHHSATPTRPAAAAANASVLQESSDSAKRSSIFDWSEQQQQQKTAVPGESTNGITLRPKTVHGKQGEDAARSRASARKDRNVAHLRSQSVPVNRESGVDIDGSGNSTKFSTWGLGHKPVSEEWSEDFEFDDVEEIDEAQIATLRPVNRDSIRSVRVPQSIIDRQASVHLQFGQVQEFMVFVEELKRLRVQGANLDLLHGQSRQLWEDAENIINLATLNEDEPQPAATFHSSSPTASDFFGDDSSPGSRRTSVEDSRQQPSLNPRSAASNPVTPPSTRPRGESLAQARNFLQTIQQQNGSGGSASASASASTSNSTSSSRQDASSPAEEAQLRARAKMPFDTQDLRKLVERAGVITRALKEIVRKAEGVAVSPQRLSHLNPNNTDVDRHSLSHIFNPPEPDASPTPSCKRPALPESRSSNSFLGSVGSSDGEERPPSRIRFHPVVEAN